MKSGNHSNALLVELLIVVLFFMLSATVLLQVFSTARNQSVRAGTLIDALNETQNVADRLYAAWDMETALSELGFSRRENFWRLDEGDYAITVTANQEAAPNGTMARYEVRAIQNEDVLLTLPVARYREVQP